MLESFRQAMLAGVGFFSTTREKVETYVQEMVKKGEISEAEAKKLGEDLLKKVNETQNGLKTKIDEMVDAAVKRMNLVKRSDVEALEKRITALEDRLQKNHD